MMPMLDGWTDVFSPLAAARPEFAHRLTPSAARTGRASCPRASRSTGRPPTWFGSSAEPIRPARRRTTRRCMPSRTSSPCFPERIRQGLHAAQGQGRSRHRHEDSDERSSHQNGRGGLLQAPGDSAEGQPSHACRRRDGRRNGEDWACARQGLGYRHARPDRRRGARQAPKTALAKMMAHAPNAGRVVNGWLITTPAGVWHQLPAKGAFWTGGPGGNPWRMPFIH